MHSDRFECEGYEFRYCFLKADGRLTDAEKAYLMFQTAEMYLHGDHTRRVVMDSLAGKIADSGREELLENYGGRHYDAEIETVQGRMNLAFLIVAPGELEEELRAR